MVKALALIPLAAALFAVGGDERTSSDVRAECAWRAVATEEMPRDIAGVAALSSRAVWAVGPAPYPEYPQSPVILHWNGHRLERTRPLGSRADPYAGLSGVAAVSADDVWAVGTDGFQPLIVHWNGTRWRIVRTPRLSRHAELYGIVALSHKDVWAVGFVGDPLRTMNPLVMHWNGRAWDVAIIRRHGDLLAVAAAGPSDLWAVGDDNGDGGSINLVDALALHWDGRRWRGSPTPTPDGEDQGLEANDSFVGVDMVSATDAWAVHQGGGSDIQHWNGRDWRISVRFRSKYLGAIAAVSRRNVWAVGGYSRPLIVHWDGRGWTDVTPPRLRRLRASFEAISAVSAREIWAAGPRLLARYSC